MLKLSCSNDALALSQNERARSDLPTRKVGKAKKPTERGKSRRQFPFCQGLGLGSLGLCMLSCQKKGTMLLYGARFYFISTAVFHTAIRDVMGPNSPKATNNVNVRICDVRNPQLPSRVRGRSRQQMNLWLSPAATKVLDAQYNFSEGNTDSFGTLKCLLFSHLK